MNNVVRKVMFLGHTIEITVHGAYIVDFTKRFTSLGDAKRYIARIEDCEDGMDTD